MALDMQRLFARRRFLYAGSALIGVKSLSHAFPAWGQTKSDPVPDAQLLEAGDLVWPRRPMAIVLYDSTEVGTKEAIKKQWEGERDAFVKAVRMNDASSPELRQIATNLEALTFEEFYMRYHTDLAPTDVQKFGAIDDVFSVGHVGIIDVTGSGERSVIEAVWGDIKRVQRISYAQWLRSRNGSWVWAARFRDVGASDRGRIASAASAYIGRPYYFWNFDLADDSSFYCSKLVWLSAMNALQIAIDNDSNPRRSFWFSPKQAWNSPRMLKVNAPRDFSY